jgi:hypothetical protein
MFLFGCRGGCWPLRRSTPWKVPCLACPPRRERSRMGRSLGFAFIDRDDLEIVPGPLEHQSLVHFAG